VAELRIQVDSRNERVILKVRVLNLSFDLPVSEVAYPMRGEFFGGRYRKPRLSS
jgi:hypothetical protein